MERQKKVVDASVLFKLYSNEIGSDKAIMLREAHIRGDFILVVPELVFLEVLNALRYKKATSEVLMHVTKELTDFQLHVERISEFLLEKAIAAALKYNLSIYDASYVALAQIHGIELVTADKALSKVPNVQML